MDNKKVYVQCVDYLVTHKKFDLVFNQELNMLETKPKPPAKELPLYYKSSSYISHTDSNKTIFDKIYQAIKKVNIKRKVNLIKSFTNNEKLILDIGCGVGDFLQACKKNGCQVEGIEPNKEARHIASNKIEKKVFENLNEITSVKFDVITLWHVLEHVPDFNEYINKIKSLLKPNGTLIVAVPNFKSYDAQYYHEFWAAFDVPRHLWHFSKQAIKSIFKKHKMIVKNIIPMKFDSYYVSILSEKNKKRKLSFLRGIAIGWYSNIKAMHTKEYSSLIYIINKE
ncbi:MAG: class I SAM-dependent methyltransferase [Lutibacter sp.]